MNRTVNLQPRSRRLIDLVVDSPAGVTMVLKYAQHVGEAPWGNTFFIVLAVSVNIDEALVVTRWPRAT